MRRRWSYYDIIDPGIRCWGLRVENEHRRRIVQTMKALMPDQIAAVYAAKFLVRLYGKPRS